MADHVCLVWFSDYLGVACLCCLPNPKRICVCVNMGIPWYTHMIRHFFLSSYTATGCLDPGTAPPPIWPLNMDNADFNQRIYRGVYIYILEGKKTQPRVNKISTQRHTLPVCARLQGREPGDVAVCAGASNGFCLAR